MKTTKPISVDLWDVEKEVKDIFDRYGFDSESYDVDKVVTIFRDLTVSRVLSNFCADNNVKWNDKDREALKAFKTELEMITHLSKAYPNPKEESFKQLIEALRPETPEYWIRDNGPSRYNTLETFEKELKEMHSKKFLCRFSLDHPWDMERALIALQKHLTGVEIYGFKGMPSSFNVEEYLTKGIDIINTAITADFKIKAFKNGRLDIIFFNVVISGDFIRKFFTFEINKFKKFLKEN